MSITLKLPCTTPAKPPPSPSGQLPEPPNWMLYISCRPPQSCPHNSTRDLPEWLICLFVSLPSDSFSLLRIQFETPNKALPDLVPLSFSRLILYHFSLHLYSSVPKTSYVLSTLGSLHISFLKCVFSAPLANSSSFRVCVNFTSSAKLSPVFLK